MRKRVKHRATPKWAFGARERTRQFKRFLRTRYKPLAAGREQVKDKFSNVALLNEIENNIPAETPSGEIPARVLKFVGKKRAAGFLRSHEREMGQAILKGFDSPLIDPQIPLYGRRGELAGTGRKERQLISKNPYFWFGRGFRETQAANYPRYLGGIFLLTLYKAAEPEARAIIENFRENVISMLDKRRIPVDMETIDEYISRVRREIRHRMISEPEAALRDFEYDYVQVHKFVRTAYYADRTLVNEITRRAAKAHGLKKLWPDDRRIMQVVSRELLGRIKRDPSTSAESLEGRAESIIRGKLDKRRKAERKRQRERKAMAEAKEPAQTVTGREARAARMSEYDKSKAGEDFSGGPEAAVPAAEEPRRTARKRSPFQRKMLQLSRGSKSLSLILYRNVRSGVLEERLVSDIATKLIQSPLAQRAAAKAFKIGFLEKFPPDAIPGMAYSLAYIKNLARRPPTLRKYVRSACEKTNCSVKMQNAVIKFLLEMEILERHHAKGGKGLTYSISRGF